MIQIFRVRWAQILATTRNLLCVAIFAASSPFTAAAESDPPTVEELQATLLEDLMQSADSSKYARVMDWLALGGDPNTVLDSDGNSFMHHAAPQELEFLAEAVRRGGNCNIENSYGATPLHFAARQGIGYGPGVDALRILARCEAGAGVKRACDSGDAAANGCRADPNARDRRGATPLHALYQGLEGMGQGVSGPRLSGIRYDVLQVLLEELGSDPNIKNYEGDTPLSLVVTQGTWGKPMQSWNHISLMLANGADANLTNSKGNTPLIEAVSLSRNASHVIDDSAAVVRALLNGGADPDLRAGNGDTPLIRAAKHKDDSLYEVRALLEGGADPCLRDGRGMIAHQHAELVGAELTMTALEKAGGYLSFVNSMEGVCIRDERIIREVAEEQENRLSLSRDERAGIQSCLKYEGHDPGPADGIFGSRTRAAIRSWQQSRGLEVSGYVNVNQASNMLDVCLPKAKERDKQEAAIKPWPLKQVEPTEPTYVEKDFICIPYEKHLNHKCQVSIADKCCFFQTR